MASLNWLKAFGHALAVLLILAALDWIGAIEMKATTFAIAIGFAALARTYEAAHPMTGHPTSKEK